MGWSTPTDSYRGMLSHTCWGGIIAGRRLPDDADVATEWNALALEVDDLPVQWTRGAPFSAVLTGVPPREALDPAHRLLDDVLRLHDAVPAGNRAGMYTLECAVYQASSGPGPCLRVCK